MDGKLMVPVPASVSAWYLVPGVLGADDAREIAVGLADERDRLIIERETCDLSVSVTSTADGEGGFRRPDFVPDSHLVSFRVSCRTGLASVHEWIARTLAAEFADEVKATAIADAGGGQWISVEEARASLHEKEDGCLRLSDWVRIAAVPDRPERTVSLETAGMARYGLPELRAGCVPSWLGDGWSVALTGLAQRIRDDFAEVVRDATPSGDLPFRAPAPSAFGVDDEIRLSADDVASAYCLRGLGDRIGHPVGLRLDQDAAGLFLTVRPPRDWHWSPRDFLESVAEGPLKPVLKAARVFDDLITGNADLEEFAIRF